MKNKTSVSFAYCFMIRIQSMRVIMSKLPVFANSLRIFSGSESRHLKNLRKVRYSYKKSVTDTN